MSALRLTGSTSGYSEITPPAVAGDQTFTLPGTGGTLTTTNGGQTIEHAAGTASAPSITFTGDVNTGIFSPAADTIAFAEGGVEAARIDSSGRVLIGTTSRPATANSGSSFEPESEGRAVLYMRTNTTSGRVLCNFGNTNGETGSIQVSGSSTSYVTSSDYRLKENVVPLTGALDRLQQIPVHRFNFIADPDKTVDGFLAHEAQEIVPECVIGEKDAVDDDGNPVYQGIDQSKLVPLLTAALQEAMERIETLEAQNATFEARLAALEVN
jgi:hypothetical protein